MLTTTLIRGVFLATFVFSASVSLRAQDVDNLVSILKTSPDAQQRVNAAHAIGQVAMIFGKSSAIKAVRPLLLAKHTDVSPNVQKESGTALDTIGRDTEEVVAAYCESFLQVANHPLRLEAIRVLRKFIDGLGTSEKDRDTMLRLISPISWELPLLSTTLDRHVRMQDGSVFFETIKTWDMINRKYFPKEKDLAQGEVAGVMAEIIDKIWPDMCRPPISSSSGFDPQMLSTNCSQGTGLMIRSLALSSWGRSAILRWIEKDVASFDRAKQHPRNVSPGLREFDNDMLSDVVGSFEQILPVIERNLIVSSNGWHAYTASYLQVVYLEYARYLGPRLRPFYPRLLKIAESHSPVWRRNEMIAFLNKTVGN